MDLETQQQDDTLSQVPKAWVDDQGDDQLPFKKKQITLSYPTGPSNEYLVECLTRAIQKELPNFQTACSLSPQSIQSLTLPVDGSPIGPLPRAIIPGHDSRIGSIQWSDYDLIDWSHLKSSPHQTLVNAYPIRKALIRKNHLVRAVESYHIKNSLDPTNPTWSRVISIPKSFSFTLCYSDELDELWMDELYDLNNQLPETEVGLHQEDKENRRKTGQSKVWILKPALADKGQGIRLFETKDQLRQIFLEFERLEDQEDERLENIEASSIVSHGGPEENKEDPGAVSVHLATCVSISQVRDWVIQEYIANPLLIDPHKPETYSKDTSLDRSSFCKHHLRVYVLAVGALSVYVFQDVLSLFSTQPYTLKNLEDLRSHITNTCLQINRTPRDGSLDKGRSGYDPRPEKQNSATIHQSDPILSFRLNHPKEVLDQIDSMISNLFSFVSQNDPVNFQLNPNCFEIFGFDFLIDANFKVWLLEINAGPDFSQSGGNLKPTIEKLFRSSIAVLKSKYPFMSDDPTDHPNRQKSRVHQDDKNHLDHPLASSNNDEPSSKRTTEADGSFPGFRCVLELETHLKFL